MPVKPKIALCVPNYKWQNPDPDLVWHTVPYGLGLIAAMIRDLCEVAIIDANKEDLSLADFAGRIAGGGFSVVGVSVLTDLFAQAGHMAASAARKAAPAATIVMGGVYPTIHPDLALASEDVDYICLGEGEYVFRELVLHLFENRPRPRTGLAFRSPDGSVVQGPPARVDDLDGLPLPAYDLIDFASYTTWQIRKSIDGPPRLPFAFIYTSRGCPQKCCFCQVDRIAGRKFRGRSPENILDEIAWYKNDYGVRSLVFNDDNLIADKKRAVALFQGLIDRGLAMPWSAMTMAIFRLDHQLIDLMVESGCKRMTISIESGSQRVLREIIKKPLDLKQARAMIDYARSLGVYVSSNFVFGLPGETWDEIRETMRFAEESGLDYVKLHPVIPLRHTDLWDLCEREGLFPPDFNALDLSWSAGQITSPFFDQRELSILRVYEWDRINFSRPEKRQAFADQINISLSELDQIRQATRTQLLATI